MACRIQNLTKHRLALDLRGGKVIYLEPNVVSQPLREELLYNHIHLPRWLAQGLVRKIDAKMAEVLEYEKVATPSSSGPPESSAAKETDTKDTDTKDAKTVESVPAGSADVDKSKPRISARSGGSSKTDQ